MELFRGIFWMFFLYFIVSMALLGGFLVSKAVGTPFLP